MRKAFRMVCASLALSTLLSIGALADDPKRGIVIEEPAANSGITVQAYAGDADVTSDNAISPQQVTKADNTTIQVCPDAEKVVVTYSNARSGSYYLLVSLSDDSEKPTSTNIQYIDQVVASSESVSFTVYPKDLKAGQKYYVCLSSNDGALTRLTKVALFEYWMAYLLGDANGDMNIDVKDAAAIINTILNSMILSGERFLAADVNGDKNIDIFDVTAVINIILGV